MKWYSRDAMWREACSFDVDAISDLSDDQFLLCLRAVHDYYTAHSQARSARQLEPYAGPQELDHRTTARLDYMG